MGNIARAQTDSWVSHIIVATILSCSSQCSCLQSTEHSSSWWLQEMTSSQHLLLPGNGSSSVRIEAKEEEPLVPLQSMPRCPSAILLRSTLVVALVFVHMSDLCSKCHLAGQDCFCSIIQKYGMKEQGEKGGQGTRTVVSTFQSSLRWGDPDTAREVP